MQEILYGVGMASDAGHRRRGARARGGEGPVAGGGGRRPLGRCCSHRRHGEPGDATMAFRRAPSTAGGVRTGDRGPRVRARRDGRVIGLDTSSGPIEAETVVLACGLWTSELARKAGASVALYPAEHVWVMTEEAQCRRRATAVPAGPRRLPVHPALPRRSLPDRCVRAQGEAEAPRTRSRPAASPSSAPTGTISPRCSRSARERVPEIESIGFSHYLRAPESFTPDSNFQLGSSCPRCRGCSSRQGSTRRASSSGRAPAWPGAVDRRRPPDDGPHRGRRRSHRPVGEPARVAARAHGRVPRRSLRDALARKQPRTAAACGGFRCTRRSARRAPRSAGRRMGTRELVRARGRWTPRSATRSTRRRGSGAARGGARDARGRGALRPVDVLEVPGPGAVGVRKGCRGLRPRISTCPRAVSCTRCCATSGAASRWTRP